MVTKTQAIKAFLNANTHADLADMYNHDMECQITVAKDDGERVAGDFKGKQWHGYTDGIQTWKPIRIPRNANSEPEYEDTPMSYDLALHAEGIGMTGWDWKARLSRWVAFDFDAITGHSEKHSKKLTDAELQNIKDLLTNVPYVTIRKSTGGKGLHVYVFLKPTPSQNHNEHAAIARAILSQLSGIAGFDFSIRVDTCGGNMWVWHRKMVGTDGLSVLKVGEQLADVPANWKDYTKVVSGKRPRNLPGFIEQQTETNPQIEDIFSQMTSQRMRVPLDADHQKLMGWLNANYPGAGWWDAEHHMLVSHTALLKEAHHALQLKGKFDTLAVGEEKGADINCFSGETLVLTDKGPRKLKDLYKEGNANLLVNTETGPQWMNCPINCFGEQETIEIFFGDGSVVSSTMNHRWPVRINSEKNVMRQTYELIKGKSQILLIKINLPTPSMEGYAHGFVYGDGWVYKSRTNKELAEVALFKEDVALKQCLLNFGTLSYRKVKDHGYVDIVRNLPGNWKELPQNPTKEYALGFVLGLISADGFVTDTGVQINQSDYWALNKIKELAIFAGIRAYQVRTYSTGNFANAKQGYVLRMSTYNFKKEFFLREDQKKKLSIKEKNNCITVSGFGAKKTELVYCPTVPFYQNFTLANWASTFNCYLFPQLKGAWAVRRYTPGVQEHPYWKQDGANWTTCYFNKELTLEQACAIFNGIELSGAKGYAFANATDAQEAAKLLGVDLNLPQWALVNPATLKIQSNGKLVASVEKGTGNPLQPTASQIAGWVATGKKFERVFSVKSISAAEEIDTFKLDERIRHIVAEDGSDLGWLIRTDNEWHAEPVSHVKDFVRSLGYSTKEVPLLIGTNISHCWKIINRPFEEEYPKNRLWNRNAAQLRFTPTNDRDDLHYPTWMLILNHLGQGLDDAVKEHPWCRSNNILTGADWLKCWIASLIKEPSEPLPYLFFYSLEQGSGKSMFQEMLNLLINRGVVSAATALMSGSAFNGEIETAVVCTVEELDLRKNVVAYNRIKDWVTNKTISLHKKGKQPYNIVNTTHWIHTSNTHLACPVFAGDTRITMVRVPPIEPGKEIPRKIMMPLLEQEAPDFLAEILSIELPPPQDRLNIPCLTTEAKQAVQEANLTMLELYLRENVQYAPGYFVYISEFWDKFSQWLDPSLVNTEWTKIKVSKQMPPQFVRGRIPATGQFAYGNMSFTKVDEKDFRPKYVLRNKDTLAFEDNQVRAHVNNTKDMVDPSIAP